jgi:hypothetical protein
LRDLTGQKFNKLTVVKRAGANRQGSVRWLCLCECGNEKVYSSDHLTRKKSSVKSCGCAMKISGSEHRDWKGCGEISGHWWYNHVERERKQGVRTKVPVTVVKEEAWDLFLEQDRKCSLSGVDIVISNTHIYNTASIDRIDSSKGYELGNIQWVHKDVNFMKRTYSQEYFIDLCKKIAKTHS